MSWIRIWVHLVFSTKDRVPLLNSIELREKVFNHIKENAKSRGIRLDCLNGHREHIHCLISLNKDQTISEVVRLIKGESSHWINQNQVIGIKFVWQDDYWAMGVSEGDIDLVRKYIECQEEHHKKKSFAEEIEEFMKKYGWRSNQAKASDNSSSSD